MKVGDIIQALRRMKAETGSLMCMGCGYEHNCGIHGCAIMNMAADRLANDQTHIAALQEIEQLRSGRSELLDGRDIYRRALKTFGTDLQTLVAIEEMSELQKELCKNRRGKENQTHIAEEIADVQIMLEQMMILYDCTEIVKKFRLYKLSRLEARISESGGVADDSATV